MPDHFSEKALEWDKNEMIRQLSAGVSSTMLEQVSFNSDMHVMDFGAGTGLISAAIAPQVNSILAVDISESMLDKLMTKPELQDKVKAVCHDILEQPLEQQFDVIVSAMALHHVEDTMHLLQRFADHLKPGGRIALADLDKEDGTFHPEDIKGVYHHGFERDVLGTQLEANGFTDVHFVTAHIVQREDADFPIFLVTASKG